MEALFFYEVDEVCCIFEIWHFNTSFIQKSANLPCGK